MELGDAGATLDELAANVDERGIFGERSGPRIAVAVVPGAGLGIEHDGGARHHLS